VNPEWLQITITIAGIIVAAIVQSFWIGKKFGDLQSDIRSLNEENEHCSRDRKEVWNRLNKGDAKMDQHGIKIATLEAQAPTWRLHKGTQ